MTQRVDVATMLALHERGLSTKEIAVRFGVKTPAITRQLAKNGIRLRETRGSFDATKDRLADLVSEGVAIDRAATIMGITVPHTRKTWRAICDGLGWQAV